MMAAHYHIYHHRSLTGLPAFTPAWIAVPTIQNPKVKRWRPVQSLRNDMAELRAVGVAKGIVDPGGRTSAGVTALGKELLLLKVGKGEAHNVLIVGGHHAREWISVEIPFLLAKYLIENYTPEPSVEDEGEVTVAQKKRIKHLVENRQIWFVPMVNPDGHYHSMTQDRGWRSNLSCHDLGPKTIVAQQYGGADPKGNPTRTFDYPKGRYWGVDINRNYPTRDWGHETYGNSVIQTSRDPQDGRRQIWVGPEKNSEKETQAMVGLIEENRFKASISYHSYGKFLVYSDLGRDAPFLQNVGDGMWQLLKDNPDADKDYPYKYMDGDSDPALYPVTGHFSDFFAERSPGQPTFTNELPPHDDHPMCKQWAFSGLPDTEIEPIFRENLTSALALINSAGFTEPAGAQKIRVNEATHTVQVVDNCWRVFADWEM
jgi:hypothetical protein